MEAVIVCSVASGILAMEHVSDCRPRMMLKHFCADAAWNSTTRTVTARVAFASIVV
jgi:hypothetical protein